MNECAVAYQLARWLVTNILQLRLYLVVEGIVATYAL
jgi:hypothetical protein